MPRRNSINAATAANIRRSREQSKCICYAEAQQYKCRNSGKYTQKPRAEQMYLFKFPLPPATEMPQDRDRWDVKVATCRRYATKPCQVGDLMLPPAAEMQENRDWWEVDVATCHRNAVKP